MTCHSSNLCCYLASSHHLTTWWLIIKMIPLENSLPNWCILLAECTFDIRAVAIDIQEEFIATIHSIVIRDYQLVTDAILAHWIVVYVDTEIWTSIGKVCLVTRSAESSIIDSIELQPGMVFIDIRQILPRSYLSVAGDTGIQWQWRQEIFNETQVWCCKKYSAGNIVQSHDITSFYYNGNILSNRSFRTVQNSKTIRTFLQEVISEVIDLEERLFMNISIVIYWHSIVLCFSSKIRPQTSGWGVPETGCPCV